MRNTASPATDAKSAKVATRRPEPRLAKAVAASSSARPRANPISPTAASSSLLGRPGQQEEAPSGFTGHREHLRFILDAVFLSESMDRLAGKDKVSSDTCYCAAAGPLAT